MNFTKKTIDVCMWDKGKDGIEPRDLDYETSEEYLFLDNERVVGCCATEVQSHLKACRGEAQFYPDSWFIGDTEYLKPVLEIPAFSFENYRKQGYGRAGLQQLFHLSQAKGCEGRIHLLANKEGPAFYEHCGFIGLEAGKNGYKYFDPTPENIAKLFSKQNMSVKMKCTFKAKKGASMMDPFNRMYDQLRQMRR